MFRMTDEAGPDEKLLCVPVGDPRQEHLQDIRHVSEFDRLEIQHFFEAYKDLEPGKSVEGAQWVGRKEAEEEVIASRQRLRDNPEAVAHSGDPSRRPELKAPQLDDVAPPPLDEKNANC
jgi:inorganic pyrophosphatase